MNLHIIIISERNVLKSISLNHKYRMRFARFFIHKTEILSASIAGSLSYGTIYKRHPTRELDSASFYKELI